MIYHCKHTVKDSCGCHGREGSARAYVWMRMLRESVILNYGVLFRMHRIYSVPFLFVAPIILQNSCAWNVICDTADPKGSHKVSFFFSSSSFFPPHRVELSSDLSQLLLAALVEKYHLENAALSSNLSSPLASATVIKSKSMILDQQWEINSRTQAKTEVHGTRRELREHNTSRERLMRT